MGAGAYTNATSQAEFFVYLGFFHLGVVRIISRDQCHGFHRAGIDAFPTTIAKALVHDRNEIGGMYRVENGKAPGSDQSWSSFEPWGP